MAKVTNLWRVVQHWLDQQRFPPNQSALAKAIGVQRSAVSDWKTGKARPSPENMLKLAQLMEPTEGPLAYTALVMAMTTDMGFGKWTIGLEKQLPEGARIEPTGDETYGVLRGIFPDERAEPATVSARDRAELESYRRDQEQAAVRDQHAAAAGADESPRDASGEAGQGA